MFLFNLQPFFIPVYALDHRILSIFYGKEGVYRKVDLGIVKYHFQKGAASLLETVPLYRQHPKIFLIFYVQHIMPEHQRRRYFLFT